MLKHLVFVFVLLLVPKSVLAQSDTTGSVETTVAPSVTKSPLKRPVISEEKKEAVMEKMSAAREKFKTRMATIKDEKKKVIVENIDSKIQGINERRTKLMLSHLGKISEVLARVSAKEVTLKAQGKDTASLSASIVAAQAAIDKAKAAVEAQALKEYNANITTDVLLRSAVTSIVNQFRINIKSVFELVLASKKAVREAHTQAAQLMGETVKTPISPTVPTAQ